MLALVDSGRGNLRSVEKALFTAGAAPVRTNDPAVVDRAERIVVPGQGAFADVMDAMRTRGLDQAIRVHIERGRPYLGICLGLQLLFDESDEHGPVAGLGIVAGRVERIQAPGLKVPHMGWNNVAARKNDDVLVGKPDEHFYFVHSFAAIPSDGAITVLEADYGTPVCAAIRTDNIVACQFHPEKSQRAGIALLTRWLEAK